MKYTQNYNLRKPEDTDPADIQDLNYNADAIDGKLKEIEDWEAAHLQASNPHSITPALIGAETPAGAQAKVNAHEQKVAPHSGHETPDGAQTKANAAASAALGSANSYTDAVAEVLEKRIDDNQALAIRTAVKPERRAGKHTKRISGYGMLSIPNNANGQVSACVIKGQTWTNKAGVGDTSPQTVENLDAAKTYLLINSAGANVEIDTVDTPTPVKLTGETSFDFVWASGKIALYELSAEEATLDVAVLRQKYHYVNGTKSTNSVAVKSVGKNLFDKNKVVLGNTVYGGGISGTSYTIKPQLDRAYLILKISPGTSYRIKSNTLKFIARGITKDLIADGFTSPSSTTSLSYTSLSSTNYLAINLQKDGGSTITQNDIDCLELQVEEGSSATPYEPYKESSAIINLPEPLRSVPSANDEVRVSEGKLIKRVSDDEGTKIKSATSWTPYAELTNTIVFYSNFSSLGLTNVKRPSLRTEITIGKLNIGGIDIPASIQFNIDVQDVEGFNFNYNSEILRIRINKSRLTGITSADFVNYLNVNLVSLIYQLAEPVVTPLDVIGELRAYPNGTVRTEPAIAGFMTEATKVVTTEDYPISEVRKVIRYDISSTGHLVETDVTSDVTVGDNNTSLTIANFEQGKTYFYDCAYPPELTTNGELILDVVVENGIITHDYAAAAADWVLDANEGKATMLICTNAGGAARIIAPACDGKMYVIRNTSGQTITIKTASSTGVTVANGKTATVIFTGNNFIKISEV